MDAKLTSPLLYRSAVDALLSPLHQATSNEAIAKSAARRTRTVQDMRYYWNVILKKHPPNKAASTTRMIHITGTKGKGSTAAFCDTLLRQYGYSTGLLTSPHLVDIRERIRWNGRPVHPNLFGRVYWKIRKALEEEEAAATANTNDDETSRPPTYPGYFRMLTLMGMYTFLYETKPVDVLIVEVGMGGRYDATNFLDVSNFENVVCGVTLLDFDHVRILGDTLEKIAWEKGGIFACDKINHRLSTRPTDDDDRNPVKKPDFVLDDAQATRKERKFFILDNNGEGVMRMMTSCAQLEGEGGTLTRVDASGKELFQSLQHSKHESLGLAGQHQFGNATLAVFLCQAAVDNTKITTASPITLQALTSASWPGRCQMYQPIDDRRFVYFLDGAHTPQSMQATVDWFQNKLMTLYCNATDSRRPILVFNCSHERNPVDLLHLLIENVKLPTDDTSPVIFERSYFASSDSSRPSPIAKATAEELLTEKGIQLRQQLLPKSSNPSWQETLEAIYKHLVANQSDILHDECFESTTLITISNRSVAQLLQDLNEEFPLNKDTGDDAPNPILVTGSLYLVGSFLNALEWVEEPSPEK